MLAGEEAALHREVGRGDRRGAAMSAGAAARKRIEDAHRFSAIYGKGMASHHPMAIAALDAMGGSEADLGAFESRYLPKLEPMPDPVVAIQEGDEAAHLGAGR